MNANRIINKIEADIETCKTELREALDTLREEEAFYTDEGLRYGGSISLVNKLYAKLDRLYHNLGRAEFEISK
jgi:hypothetical protein